MDDIKFRVRSTSGTSASKNRARQPSAPRRTSSNYTTVHKRDFVAKNSRPVPAKVSTPADEEPLIPLNRLKQEKRKSKKNRSTKKVIRTFFIALLMIGVVAGVSYGVYSYISSQNSELAKASDADNNSEALALAIKQYVSNYLEDIPSETPKLETISDPTSAGNGGGFKDTQPGDKVLYFESAGKAVIYRPSTGKVLVYTYFTDSGSSANQQQTQSTDSTEQIDTTTSGEADSSSSNPSPLLP